MVSKTVIVVVHLDTANILKQITNLGTSFGPVSSSPEDFVSIYQYLFKSQPFGMWYMYIIFFCLAGACMVQNITSNLMMFSF